MNKCTMQFRYTEWQDHQAGKTEAIELYDPVKDLAETINVADNKEYASTIRQFKALPESRGY
jgi:hypothetical protein